VERRERDLRELKPEDEKSDSIERVKKLRSISYQEVTALGKFINEQTPFSTKHGVKGAEFENVLVVVGRGWNQYNFNKYLESGLKDQEAFERNRNLFYVVCSRPQKRLAILFTQQITDQAVSTLSSWFGSASIHSLHVD
jgi:DNA helicase-2/ATP-dependent DNA helicase PcrA